VIFFLGKPTPPAKSATFGESHRLLRLRALRGHPASHAPALGRAGELNLFACGRLEFAAAFPRPQSRLPIFQGTRIQRPESPEDHIKPMTLRTTVSFSAPPPASLPPLTRNPPARLSVPRSWTPFPAAIPTRPKAIWAATALTLGDVSISRFDFSVSGRMPLAQGLIFTPGLAYTHTSLDASAGIALPESVQELSLNLGLRGLINKNRA